jgi:hypothetical protein
VNGGVNASEIGGATVSIWHMACAKSRWFCLLYEVFSERKKLWRFVGGDGNLWRLFSQNGGFLVDKWSRMVINW